MGAISVLTDGRKGSDKQSMALAKALGLGYEEISVEYNFLKILPNFILSLYPFHIKGESLRKLENKSLGLIIACGRRLAALSYYLKKRSKNRIKIVQILKPGLPPEAFDLIISPRHDNFGAPNVLDISGALGDAAECSENYLEEIRKKYRAAKGFVAVLLGGDSKNYRYGKSSVSNFVTGLKKIKKPLFITFSRRTPDFVKKAFLENFSGKKNIFYDPLDGGINPYNFLLKEASIIICTSDSISMLRETSLTAKPLYIYIPEDFKSKKHLSFVEELRQEGTARKFNPANGRLEIFVPKTKNSEISSVASEIRKLLRR